MTLRYTSLLQHKLLLKELTLPRTLRSYFNFEKKSVNVDNIGNIKGIIDIIKTMNLLYQNGSLSNNAVLDLDMYLKVWCLIFRKRNYWFE